MPDDVTTEFTRALKTAFTGSDLESYIGGRMFEDEAPRGTIFPYAIFSFVTDTPDWLFVERFENPLVQFDLYSTSKATVEIKEMYKRLKALYDDADLAISGGTLLKMHRRNMIATLEDVKVKKAIETARHWTVDYDVKIELD